MDPTIMQPLPKSGRVFKVFTLLCLAALAAGVGWLLYKQQNQPETPKTTTTQTTQPNTNTTTTASNTTITSGKGGFKLSVPPGWGPIIKAADADFLIITGTAQPTVSASAPVKVTTVSSYGADGSSLFSAFLTDKGKAATPRGDASMFTIGKDPDAITATKYTYIYPKDELVGVGSSRFMGDRDYEYVIPHGDKELHIYYGVYGSDPRNQADIADEIARSVTF